MVQEYENELGIKDLQKELRALDGVSAQEMPQELTVSFVIL